MYTINCFGQATFDWNCGGTIIVNEGVGHLYSPRWPGRYPFNLNCTYKLVSPGNTITLRTEAFSLEAGMLNYIYNNFIVLLNFINQISNVIHLVGGRFTRKLSRHFFLISIS